MINVKERYSELVSLTQLYIQREYQAKEATLVNPDIYSYFYQRAKRRIPIPKVAPPISLPPPVRVASVASIASPDLQIAKGAASSHIPVPEPQPLPPLVSAQQLELPPSPLPTNPPIEPIQNKTVGISNKKTLSLEPLTPPSLYQMDSGFKELINSKYPNIPIYETIPDDGVARKLKNAWQKENVIPPIIILTFNQDEQHTTFLKNMAKAITLRLAPARVISGLKIEAEKKWDKLVESKEIQMIIACDYGFFLQPGLKKYHREDSKQGKHFLGEKPLLLLSDLNLYLQQPQLKALLWQAICNEFE